MLKTAISHLYIGLPNHSVLTTNINYFRAIMGSKIPRNPRINPLQIYHINPRKINLAYDSRQTHYSVLFSPVAGGVWDRDAANLEEYDIIYSLMNHFNNDVGWEETDFYRRAQKTVSSEREWSGNGTFGNMQQFERYLNKIDDLYSKIESEGFKSQKELYESEFRSRPYVNKMMALNDVTVSVGRDGQLMIHENGYHRLAIAKALDIEEIPVRIKIRHTEWQEKRKKSVKRGTPVIKNHPDLRNLCESAR